MPRSPKGVVARAVPEWNAQNLFLGGYELGGTGTNGQTTGLILYNNSSGQSLVIWHAGFSAQIPYSTASTLPLPPYLYGVFINGIINHSNILNGATMAPHNVGAAPIGQLYTYQFGSTPGGLLITFIDGLQNGVWQWPHEYPLVTVPPGYSFFLGTNGLTSTFAAAQVAATFLWEAVNSPYP